MKQIVLDFETFYSDQYSLRKMPPVNYILDPRFETIGCAVKEDGAPSVWMTPDELRAYLAGLPPKVVVISHNALFDMCVLAWRFNYVPFFMVDTMAMARAWWGHKIKSVALAYVARFLGIGEKGTTVHKVEGMSLAAIQASGFYEEYAEYSKGDADLCWEIYQTAMREGFPPGELVLGDSVLRCAVLPRFQLDAFTLAEHLNTVRNKKAGLLARVATSQGHLTKDDLMSNERFAEALRQLGVDPPMKISLTTGKETYAFAKTDQDFIELEEHENPDVQALVAARLGIKSTIEETRTERLLAISRLTWPGNRSALMPIPLRVSGAHTHRLSGDWKLNLQNLPRAGKDPASGKLRRALVAPKGHVVVAVDASQIEARVAGWFAGAWDLVNAFAAKEDVYSSFASSVFGYAVTKSEHPVERFIGKTAVLGLQYGLGGPKFQRTIAVQSKSQVGQEVVLDDLQATRVIQTYRARYHQIPAMWRRLESLIPRMTGELNEPLGPLVFQKNRVLLPTGLFLNYHKLEHNNGQWWFEHGGVPKYLYGGKFLENITQALARIIVMDAAMRIRKDTGRLFALQVHDELVFVVKEAEAEALRDYVIAEMRKPPSWGPEIPLDAEGGIGPSYGDAK